MHSNIILSIEWNESFIYWENTTLIIPSLQNSSELLTIKQMSFSWGSWKRLLLMQLKWDTWVWRCLGWRINWLTVSIHASNPDLAFYGKRISRIAINTLKQNYKMLNSIKKQTELMNIKKNNIMIKRVYYLLWVNSQKLGLKILLRKRLECFVYKKFFSSWRT